MAGNLIVDTLQLGTGTSTFRILSNTGAVIMSANASGVQLTANTVTYGMLSPDLIATQNNVYNVTTSNANTVLGSTSVTFTSNTGTISAGMIMYGAGFGRGTTVDSVVNANTIVVSTAAANTSTNTRMSFVEPNKLITADVAAPGLCKAWVNFNGTGTVAIRNAFNVSSITDNGTGIYTVNFTTAMPDENISVAGSAKEGDSGTTDTLFKIVEVASNPSASSVRVMTGGPSTAWDSTVVMVSVFR